ncbi:nucleolar protein 12 [Kipferlia bialata]|uniref:Nucleolar protein 12 n=1 Tax=Kipferlia bialata TaxID=797122 RepID=A0A391NWC6_9EUKA|nr:nucleolar protein 12 [Kipferlia bialata]|eukprot:g13864.t1
MAPIPKKDRKKKQIYGRKGKGKFIRGGAVPEVDTSSSMVFLDQAKADAKAQRLNGRKSNRKGSGKARKERVSEVIFDKEKLNRYVNGFRSRKDQRRKEAIELQDKRQKMDKLEQRQERDLYARQALEELKSTPNYTSLSLKELRRRQREADAEKTEETAPKATAAAATEEREEEQEQDRGTETVRADISGQRVCVKVSGDRRGLIFRQPQPQE